MIKRDIEAKYGKYVDVYRDICKKAERDFTDKVETISVFHEVLADRIADAYVELIKADEVGTIAKKGAKDWQERLQRWLALSFGELHASVNEAVARRTFYKKISEIINSMISDSSLKRSIFVAILDVMKKDKVEVDDA